MGLFESTTLNSFEDLFMYQIQDLYDAENRLVAALPSLVEGAVCPELRSAFQEHLRATEVHVMRLEEVFAGIGQDPVRTSCKAMKGLIRETEDLLDMTGASPIKDAALLAAAQRVEHYEIAAYGTARTLAGWLGRSDLVATIEKSLAEEVAENALLARIAEQCCRPNTAGDWYGWNPSGTEDGRDSKTMPSDQLSRTND